MEFIPLKLEGAFKIIKKPNKDSRGSFTRIYCKEEYELHGLEENLVQINKSYSKKKGTLRGLHYQEPPNSEIKVVQCLKGAIFDVIVDVRKESSTFLQWYGVELTDNNNIALYIPKGFAHGFITLTDDTEIIYFVSEFYKPEAERGLNYRDPKLNIKWPAEVSEISEKDYNRKFIEDDFLGV